MLRLPILAAAAALLLTGCTGSSDDTLTVYSGRSEALVAPLFEQFTAETGIAVDVRYGDSAELAAQILEEGDNRPADVFFAQDAGALGALAAEGVFMPLASEITDRVPAQFRATDNTWVGVSGRARVFVYNPTTVTNLPTSVLDLQGEEWQGRIGIAPSNASFQSFITGLRVLKGDATARDFLQAMKRNAVLFEKNSQILEAVENGEIDLGLVNHYYWFERAAELGAAEMNSKFGWFTAGDPGNLVNVAGVGALSDNPAAAQFIDWLLDTRAQQFFVSNTAEYALVAGIEPQMGLPQLTKVAGPAIDLNNLADLSTTLTLIADAGLI